MDKATIILTITSLFMAFVSLVAIVLSVFTYIQSSKTALKVNSKEHELMEGLKSDMLELIATLRFIDRKAASIDYSQTKRDFSYEIDKLSRIQMSPGYLIYLHSTGLGAVDDSICNLLELLLTNDIEAMNNVRYWVRKVLNDLRDHTNIPKESGDIVIEDVLKEWCNKKCTFVIPLVYYGLERMEKGQREKAFLKKLLDDGCKNSDVQYVYDVLCNASEESTIDIEKNVDIHITCRDILKNHQEEYDEFCKMYLTKVLAGSIHPE